MKFLLSFKHKRVISFIFLSLMHFLIKVFVLVERGDDDKVAVEGDDIKMFDIVGLISVLGRRLSCLTTSWLLSLGNTLGHLFVV